MRLLTLDNEQPKPLRTLRRTVDGGLEVITISKNPDGTETTSSIRTANVEGNPGVNSDRPNRILIVDDESEWTNALRELYEKQGYIVDTTDDAEEAKRLLGENNYSGAVLDGMEGEYQDILTQALQKGVKPVFLSADVSRLGDGVEIHGITYAAKNTYRSEKALSWFTKNEEPINGSEE